jgi:hypothetical protein
MPDKSMQALYDACSSTMIPGIVVVALYRSFLAPLLVHERLPRVLRDMLTCPLCLGFHISWIWMLVRLRVTGTQFTVLDWFTLPVTGGVIAYAFEHTLAVLVEIAPLLASLRNRINSNMYDDTNDLLDAPDTEPHAPQEQTEDVIERIRRGGCP